MQIELSLLGVHAPSVKAPPQPTLVPGPAVGAARKIIIARITGVVKR